MNQQHSLIGGWLLPALAMGMYSALAVGANGEYRITSHSDLMYHDIQGPGAAASFYDSGTHYLHESQLYYLTTLQNGWESELDLGVRLTDSRQFDSQDASVQRLAWRLADAKNTVNLGDYYANLSSYSMNKTIKGGAYQYNYGEDTYLRMTYGTFDGQWSFLLNQNDPLEPMERTGGGLRLQRSWGDYRIGLNLAHVSDDKNDPDRAGADAYSQWLTALDWEWRDGPFLVSGEHAYADTDIHSLPATRRNDTGSAHKADARARLGKVRLDARVERVSPEFRTLGGGATPDRLRFYAKADGKVERNWTLFGIANYYHNNLDNQLAARTHNDTEELGVRRDRMFDRRHMKGAVSLRRSAVEASDGSQDRETYRLKLDLRDQVLETVDVRGTWEHTLQDVDVAGQRGTDSDLYSLGLSSRHRLKNGWQLRPNLELGYQEVDNLTSGQLDQTNILRVGLTGDDRGGDEFALFYDRTDTNISVAGSDATIGRFHTYWQHKLRDLKDASIRFEYTMAPYDFETSTRDYDEQLFKISFIWNGEGHTGD